MSSRDKNNDDKKNKLVGVFTTILVNTCFLLILLCTMGVAEPRPQLTVIALEIEPDKEIPEPKIIPPPPPPLPSKPAQAFANKPQERTSSGAKPDVVKPKEPAAPSMVDETGDVELPDKNQKTVDKRTLYQSDDSGTVTAQAIGERDARTLYSGSSEGQDVNNKADNVTSFDLGGRSLARGYSLGKPENKSNKEGKVVVEITVNQDGKVIKAKARALGSTVQDAALWKAAEDEALKAVFNTDKRAQAIQVGTITYIFKLR